MTGRPHAGGPGPPPPPPRLLVVAGAVVLAVATALAVIGAFRTGITTDEPIHVMRLRNLFDTGWYALDWDYARPGRAALDGDDASNVYVYGPVAMLLLHAWSVLWGVESWGQVATSEQAYDVRHLGVVVIGLVGLAAVAALGRVLLRHWGWGLVAAAVLAAVPMWTGNQMYNVKDVPVATGHTLATLGLVLFLSADPPRRRRRAARAALLTAGLVLTLGTRPGMWTGLTVLSVVAVAALLRLRTGRRATLTTLAELGGCHLVAAVLLVAAYPNLFGSPLQALPRTSEASSEFLDGATSGRLYVPWHLVEEVPSLLLGFMLTGAVVVAVVVVRRRTDEPVLAGRLALVGVQAFTLPTAAVLLGSDLYHGLRQLLFVVPALAVLAVCGMAWWQGRAVVRPRPRLLAGVAAAALALPTVDQVTLQPYQATYVTFAADVLAGAGRSPEDRPGGDYWRASLPELVAGAQLDHQLLCKSSVALDSGVAYPFVNAGGTYSTSRSTDCREEANGPLAPQGLPVVRRLPVAQFDAVFVGPLPENCVPRRQVSRSRHGLEVVVSTLARCTVDPAPLTEVGVRALDPAIGTTRPGDLWLYASDGWVQWPGRPALTAPVASAGLVFRTTPACAPHGCVLVIAGGGPDDLVVTVDGRRVPLTRGPRHTLRVPVDAGHAGEDVWVRLRRAGGDPLDVRLRGLTLLPNRATMGPA